MTRSTAATQERTRQIVHRTHGRLHGPITRLMSPSDLGQSLKPFVFLDLFDDRGNLVLRLRVASAFGHRDAHLPLGGQCPLRRHDWRRRVLARRRGRMVQGRRRRMAWRRRRQLRPVSRIPALARLAVRTRTRAGRKHLPKAAGRSREGTCRRLARHPRRGVEPAKGAVLDQLSGRAAQGRRNLALRAARRSHDLLGRACVGKPCRIPSPCTLANSLHSSRRTRRSTSMPKPTPSSSSARPQAIRMNSPSDTTRCTRVRLRFTPANSASPR